MDRHAIVREYLLQVPENACMVELGVHTGHFSEFLLRETKGTTLHCVDPYFKFPTAEYKDAMNDKSQADFDSMFQGVQSRLKVMFGERAQMVRHVSIDAAKQFQNESIDFLYLDGNHAYKNVMEDLECWLPKMKKGSILVGDDVCDFEEHLRDADGNVRKDWSPGCYGYYGVYKAVCDIKKKYSLPLEVKGTQFIMHC